MIRRSSMLAVLFAFLPGVSQAGVLMLVDGVVGPSNALNHSGWFDLHSLSWGIDGSKDAASQNFTVTLRASAAIAVLEQAAASGTTHKRVVFDHVKTSATSLLVTLRLTCSDAVFRSFASAHNENDAPNVALSIKCGKILWENFDYTEQGVVSKTAKGSWNFVLNTP